MSKNIYPHNNYLLILVECALIFYIGSTASSPLAYVRDNYMASYQVGLTFTAGSGPLNVTGNFAHSPDISPTSINYRMFGSTGFGSDYVVSLNTLSLQFQMSKNGATGMTASLYSDYIQNFHNYVWVSLMIIDVLSPAYQHVLCTTTRFNNQTLAPNVQLSRNVAVSTMNSSSLVITNSLKIYSFVVGYIITSSNSTLQFSASGEIVDSSTIKVGISSTANLINVTYVRIDTVVVDKTLLQFTGFMKLDFQTADCPTHAPTIIFLYPSYTSNFQNIITGLSYFTLNANRYFMALIVNPANVTMNFNPSYNFTRIIYSNLAFVNLKCPPGFPNYDKPTNYCYNTVCASIGFYRVATPDQCLACLYDCYTCTSGTSCTSCNLTVNHREMSNISRCPPVDGYYDDGTNNPTAQPCASPCQTCQLSAINCTSCISDTYYIDLALQRCPLCSSAITNCLTCNNSYTCTSCQDGFYIQRYNCSYGTSGYCYRCAACLYLCQTCNDGISCQSCNASKHWTFDPNNTICIPINGFCDDMTNNPFAQPCNSPCSTCFQGVDNCTSCISNTYYLDAANYQCQPCQTALTRCLTCSDSLNCIQYCQYTCFTCNNPTTCTSCDSSSSFRIMNTGTSLCDPIDGYYDDGANNSIAFPCTKPCEKCSKTPTNCTSCVNNTYYYNSIAFNCVLCKTPLKGCLTCSSSSICTLCDSSIGYTLATNFTCVCLGNSFFAASNQTCTVCNRVLPGCQKCPSQLECQTCSVYFLKLVSPVTSRAYCQQICGDGFLFNLQCDDGNLIDGDGCSSNCTVQPLYTCNGGSSTQASTCFYIGNIEIQTISYIKTPNKNQIQLKFLISPCSNLSNSLINKMFVPDFPYQSMQLSYNSATCQLSCDITYNSSLNSNNGLQVQFKLPLTANFSQTNNIKISLNPITDNNLALKVYDSSMYSQMDGINNFSKAISYIFMILFFVGFVSGLQLYSLELMFVFQYAYSGLLTINKLQLSMESLKYLYISYGIFDFNDLNPQKNAYLYQNAKNSLPTRMKSLGFSQSMVHNINGSLLVPWIILVVGIVMYFACKRFNNRRWKVQATNIINWWVPYWLVVIQIPTMVSMWITWNYQNSSYSSFPLNIFVSILYLFVNIGLYAYIFKQTKFIPNTSKVQNLDKKQLQNGTGKKSQSQQNQSYEQKIKKTLLLTKQIKQYFKQKQQQKMKNGRKLKRKIDPKDYFYFSTMVYRLLLTIVIVFLNFSVASNVICLALSLIIFFYICFALPYLSNIRPIYNGIVVIILSVIFAYEKSRQNEEQVDFFSFYGVVFLLSLLLLTLIVNGYIIVKQAFERIYNFIKEKREESSANNSKHGQEIQINETLQDISISKQSGKEYSKKSLPSSSLNNQELSNNNPKNQKGKSQGRLQVIDLSSQLQNEIQPSSIFNLDSVSQKRF